VSEVSIDTLGDNDRWHPHTDPPVPREFDEDNLQRLATHLVATLHGRTQNAARFPKSELLERLQALKEEMDLAILFLSGAEPVEPHPTTCDRGQLLQGLHKLLRWIWRDGKADLVTAADRLAVATAKIIPPLLGNPSQVDLMAICGTKDRQGINRHAIEFREHFGYFDQRDRSDGARQKFRRIAANRKQRRNAKHAESDRNSNQRDNPTKTVATKVVS
jgi:hypothetical protein